MPICRHKLALFFSISLYLLYNYYFKSAIEELERRNPSLAVSTRILSNKLYASPTKWAQPQAKIHQVTETQPHIYNSQSQVSVTQQNSTWQSSPPCTCWARTKSIRQKKS